MAEEVTLRPVDIVLKLTNTQDVKVQREAVKAAWDADLEDFFVGLELASNPSMDFGVKSTFFIDEEDDGAPGEFTFNDFTGLALKLSNPECTEKTREKMLESAALTANITEWNFWYRLILMKSLTKMLPMSVIADALLELTTGK